MDDKNEKNDEKRSSRMKRKESSTAVGEDASQASKQNISMNCNCNPLLHSFSSIQRLSTIIKYTLQFFQHPHYAPAISHLHSLLSQFAYIFPTTIQKFTSVIFVISTFTPSLPVDSMHHLTPP